MEMKELNKAERYRQWAKKIIDMCNEKGSVEAFEVPKIIGVELHPSHILQLLSWIARMNPTEFSYEDQTLILNKQKV